MNYITIHNYKSIDGYTFETIHLDYHVYGNTESDKIVLVNHALTGNSQLSGKTGWWSQIVANGSVIDLNKYKVIAFNLPGNGSSEENQFSEHFFHLELQDIAKLYLLALDKLGIKKLYANIGGSIGAMLSWQISILSPNIAKYLIPIAGHYESTDWIIAFNFIQKSLFKETENAISLARIIAMLSYRTSHSFQNKFSKAFDKQRSIYQVESYLSYQGEKLRKRFNPDSYRLMLHYMNEAHIKTEITGVESKIVQININSDILYPTELNTKNKEILDKKRRNNDLYTIQSIHGHDAFLIEFEQLEEILKKYFNN